MSSSIWTQCGGISRAAPFAGSVHRVVEAQHLSSTLKLVDDLAEQSVLEQLIERHKPQMPPESTFDSLHFLLATPFRYPPLRHGSRFGRRHERGVFYGAQQLRAALAEVAYYRLLFLEGTEATLPRLRVELTSFVADVATDSAVDLTAPPFREYEAQLASKTDYGAAQALGTEARRFGVAVLLYRSARDPQGGTNIAVFIPTAFARRTPRRYRSWLCWVTRDRVELLHKSLQSRRHSVRYGFDRKTFEVDSVLPSPAR